MKTKTLGSSLSEKIPLFWDSTMTGISFALAAMVGWGLWAFLQKASGTQIGPLPHSMIQGITAVSITVGILVIFRPEVQLNSSSLLLSMAGGVVISFANLAFLLALMKGSASVVVPVSALYPIITIVLAFIVSRESPSSSQLVGVVLALAAIFLLTKSGTN